MINWEKKFEFLKSKGIRIPLVGKPYELAMTNNVDYCVVWDQSNCNNYRFSIKDAIRDYPDQFCVEYIDSGFLSGKGSKMTRMYQIGDVNLWVEFSSKNNWRANKGQVDTKIIRVLKDGYHPLIYAPYFSIDYIVRNNIHYAVDYSKTNGIKGLGIENYLSRSEIKRLIRKSLDRVYIPF